MEYWSIGVLEYLEIQCICRVAGDGLGSMRKKGPNPCIAMGETGEVKIEKGRFYLLFREIVLGTARRLNWKWSE